MHGIHHFTKGLPIEAYCEKGERVLGSFPQLHILLD